MLNESVPFRTAVKLENTISRVHRKIDSGELFLFFLFNLRSLSLYRVFLEKVLHKRKEKMQEKMKMT